MQKISIKNFMALQDVDIEINNLLILIGEQASGKSTASKLIYFFKSLRQDLAESVYEDLDQMSQLSERFRHKVSTKFSNYFGSTTVLEPFQIRYSYSEDRHITFSLEDDKSLKIDVEPHSFHQSLFGSEIINFAHQIKHYSQQENIYEENIYKQREFQKLLGMLSVHINLSFHDYQSLLFLPAGRNISVNYPSQFRFELYGNLRSDLAQHTSNGNPDASSDLYLMTKFLEYVERIKQRFQSNDFQALIDAKRPQKAHPDKDILYLVIKYMEKILRGAYRHDQQGEKIYYNSENTNGGYVHLNNASSGQQEAIRILQDAFLTLLDMISVFRVVEEPEAHLYPRAQKYLMEVLAIVVNRHQSQLILTTHSPYILSIINNLLFATRVGEKNPSALEEIEAVIPRPAWLDPRAVGAYFLANGTCESIFDADMGLIDQNKLDEISEELAADFQELYHIHAEAFA